MKFAGHIGGAVAATLICGAASAQDYPKLEAEAEFSVQSEKIVGNKDQKKLTDTFGEIELGFGLYFSEPLSLQGRFKLEPVRSTTVSRGFEDQGAFVEELFINYETNWFSLFAGKFNPRFGTAWDRLSDLFQKGFAEDYERTEALAGC